MQELRREKDELGRHFWNVTEQHKLLNDEHQQLKGQLQAIDQQMQANHQRALLAEEVRQHQLEHRQGAARLTCTALWQRAHMTWCDQESRKAFQHTGALGRLQATVDLLVQENRQLAASLETKESEVGLTHRPTARRFASPAFLQFMVVCSQLRNTQQELEQLQNSFAELTVVAEAEHSSSESMRTELHAARHQLGSMGKEVRRIAGTIGLPEGVTCCVRA